MIAMQAKDKTEEYSIYVYRAPEEMRLGQSDWERKRTTHSKYRALRMAKKYHESADYHRVEVKRKSFNAKYACDIDETFKVLDAEIPEQQKKRHLFMFGSALAFVAITGFGIFLI